MACLLVSSTSNLYLLFCTMHLINLMHNHQALFQLKSLFPAEKPGRICNRGGSETLVRSHRLETVTW